MGFFETTLWSPTDIPPVDLSHCLQLLAFLQGLFTFYHEGYELASEFEPYKRQLQFNLQNVSMNIDFKSQDNKRNLDSN